MSLANVSKLEKKFLIPTYDRQPLLLKRGQGVYLWDSRGKRYLDFVSGLGVNALGHNHPAIQKVLRKQASLLIHTSNLYYHDYQSKLAERLTKISGLDRVFFSNSGTEAWDGALKIARAFAQANKPDGGKAKWRILAMENSFHGRTYGALSTTGQEKYRAPFEPVVPGVVFVNFNDVADLERKFDDTVCAVCLETIQGEGGIQPVTPEFLSSARQLTERNGALLILDEIQCGLGRTGRHFAYEHYKLQQRSLRPDLLTVAKPLAAGLPLGAILATDRVASAMHPGLHGTTFGGGPLACAVALEFLRQEQSLLKHVATVGKHFEAGLRLLDEKHGSVQDIRGAGLMRAIELQSPEMAKIVLKELLEEGIIINRTHEKVLRFLPPYIIEKKHVDVLIGALDHALEKCEKAEGEHPRPETHDRPGAKIEKLKARKTKATGSVEKASADKKAQVEQGKRERQESSNAEREEAYAHA